MRRVVPAAIALALALAPAAGRAGWLEEVAGDGLRRARSVLIERDGEFHLLAGGTLEAADHLYYAAGNGSDWDLQPLPGWRGCGANPDLLITAAGRPVATGHDRFGLDLLFFSLQDGRWSRELVASLGRSGEYSSIVETPAGELLIAFSGEQGWNVRLARQSTAGWTSEIVYDAPAGSEAGVEVRLALDQAGEPLVFFGVNEGGQGQVVSVRRDGSDWAASTLLAGARIEALDLAPGAAGQLYLACGAGGVLRCGTVAGSSYSPETVDADGAGATLALALAADGQPRLAYSAKVGLIATQLRYARRGGSGWEIDSITGPTESRGLFPALALRSTGEPCIASYAPGDQRLEWAERQSGTWNTTPIAATSCRGAGLDLVHTGTGWAMIYEESDGGSIAVAREAAGAWVESTVADEGSGPALATAPDGGLVAAWAADSPRHLHVARENGGAWTSQLVDDDPEAGVGASACGVALPQPGVFIAYRAGYAPELRGAIWDGAGAAVETLDDAADLGAAADAGATAAGWPAVAYARGTDVIYLAGGPSGWQSQVLASGVDPVALSLAHDPDGRPAVAFLDESTDRIKLAVAGLATEDVADCGIVGMRVVSLAYAADGQPWIAFYHRYEWDLRLARRDGSGWSVEVVAEHGAPGQPARLGIAPDGLPLLAFADPVTLDAVAARPEDQGLRIEVATSQAVYTAGDIFELRTVVTNPEPAAEVDQYVILDVYGEYWFWPLWQPSLDSRGRHLAERSRAGETLLAFNWPAGAGSAGGIRFWAALLWAGSGELAGDYGSCEWGFQ